MTVRYPWGPLARLAGPNPLQRLGVDHRQVARYFEVGLSPDRADVLATRLGLHPAEVWPEWGRDVDEAGIEARRARWRKANARQRRRHAARIAARKRAYRVETVHARRVYMARWQAENPGRVAANSKRWREENREQVNAARRERYRTDPAYRQRILEAQRRRDRAKRGSAA